MSKRIKASEASVEIKFDSSQLVPVACPTCEGTGEIKAGDLARQQLDGVDIKNPEVARMRSTIATTTMQRDGWRKIGEACIAAAFGYTMGGFGDTPPSEVLDALTADKNVIETLRDSMLGRAWRARGVLGEGTCDYPLCAHRERPPKSIRVAVEDSRGTRATLTVCDQTVIPVPMLFPTDGSQVQGRQRDNECWTWAQWVQARAKAGHIEIRP